MPIHWTRGRWLAAVTAFLSSLALTPAWAAPVSLAARPAESTVARTHSATGIPSWILIGENDQASFARRSPNQSASAYLRANAPLLGLSDSDKELELARVHRDFNGGSHFVYGQNYRGVPVFGADLKVHTEPNGKLRALTGVVVPDINVDPHPSIDPTTAASSAAMVVAKHHRETPSGLTSQDQGLVIFREGLLEGIPGTDRLAYHLIVSKGANLRDSVFVDAHSGTVLLRFSLVHQALFRRLYEDDTSNEIWTEGDAFPGALDQWQRNEIVAAEHSYNFFSNAFGYISYDNADAEMLTVNNDPTIDCPNANWNGFTANYCTGTASDDVIAHEWGHAYTEYTSNLIYFRQSGALNESFSDIWGETVDLLNGYEDSDEDLSERTGCGSSHRWLLSEDASAFGGAIRDMWDPTCGNDPGKVSDVQYVCDGNNDGGGVHSNSGIPNHLYTLLVDGGTYNGQVVSSIGFTKAAHLHWRAQSVYEGRTTDFEAHADALEAACSDLTGINLEGLSTAAPTGPSGEMITVADCQEVTDAIAAVELRTGACPGQFEPMLDPDAPGLCNFEIPLDLVVQDFESGLGSWSVGQNPVNPSTWDSRDWNITSQLPEGRSGLAIYGPDPFVGNCFSDLDNGRIFLDSPAITIPGGSPPLIRLAFDHYVSMENRWDGGNLKFSTDGLAYSLIPSSAFIFNAYNDVLNSFGVGNDNPMSGQEAFTGSDGGTLAGSWGQSQINLTTLGVGPGDTFYLRWELGTDGCNGWDGWYVDDIRIYACALSSTTTSTTMADVECPIAPATGCKTASANGFGRSSVQIKDSGVNTKDKFKWKWAKGEFTSLGDFPDPVNSPSSSYTLCVYDESASPQPLYQGMVDTMGICGGKPCWKDAGGRGYRFKDKSGSQASIQDISLRVGDEGKAQISIKGKGAGFAALIPPLETDVTVQLLAGDGFMTECWETVFSAASTNAPGAFKARGP